MSESQYYKVQTFIPETHLQLLKDKLNEVITPLFCCYDYVFATSVVTGNWRALPGAHPHQGEIGKIEIAAELKLEFTILAKDLENVFATIQSYHPYEAPVIEAFAVILPAASKT